MKNLRSLVPFAGLLVFLPGAFAVSQSAQAGRAMPVDAIGAILDAFRNHPLVALGDGAHGNVQGHAFRLSLVRDPRFAASVNDIVVEFGNARYQDVMDRFVRGEPVAKESLRDVWQNTSQPTGWDSPIYEEFFRAIRDANARRPIDRRLRVLLADRPVNWEQVHSADDVFKGLTDDGGRFLAGLIDREVLAKHRRALLLFGNMHLADRFGYSPNTLFNIWTNFVANLQTLQHDVVSWPAPSLAMVRGAVLGSTDFEFYTGRPLPPGRGGPMEEKFDAILYLGPRSAMTFAPLLVPEQCSDSAYMQMRTNRLALMPDSQPDIDRLRQFCASQQPRK